MNHVEAVWINTTKNTYRTENIHIDTIGDYQKYTNRAIKYMEHLSSIDGLAADQYFEQNGYNFNHRVA